MQRRILAILGFAFAACHGGRGSTPIPPPDCRVNLDDTSLGPGDVFDVRVYDEGQLSGTYRVSAEGAISFPLVGAVQVAGQTQVR